MTYTIKTNNGELYHHGILGQKWGKQQGPPYPLDASDHSAAEKKAGWRKSLSNKINAAAESNAKRIIAKSSAKSAYKSGEIDKKEYKARLKDANKQNWKEHGGIVASKKGSRLERKASNKRQEKAELKEKLKSVDPELAKNRQTKRAAMDYHILSDRQFRVKYKVRKEKFAKRYYKTKGDTYSLGLKKAMLSAAVIANSSDVKYFDLRSGKVKTIKMGKYAAVKALSYDIGYSEAVTRLGYDNAESIYKEQTKN